jgi:hypothetical protein
MANGQVVLVTTERLGGAQPMRTVYYIAEEDPAKAEAILPGILLLLHAPFLFGQLRDLHLGAA